VAEPAFTRAFLRRAIEIERVASTAEVELLNTTLARIVDNPYHRSDFPPFMTHNIRPSLSGLARFLSNSRLTTIQMRSPSSVSFIAHKVGRYGGCVRTTVRLQRRSTTKILDDFDPLLEMLRFFAESCEANSWGFAH
jgi:hypothetical protein